MMRDNYRPHARHSPLTAPWEPILSREAGGATQLALSVLPVTQDASAVTVALSLDFMDTARIGDFIEFRPAILKVGRTLAFVECRVRCGDRLIARASATFRML